MNQTTLQTVSQNMNKLCLSLILGIASSVLLTHPTHAATLGQNLIVNGDAEQGLGDQVGNKVGTDIPPIPGWTTSGNFSVLEYGATGFEFTNAFGNVVRVNLPAVDVPGPDNRGKNLFFGGASRASSSASQSIDINNLASVIDTGKAAFDLSGWLGGYDDDDDSATLNINFLDQTNQSLGIATISAPNATARNNVTGLYLRETNGFIPVGTRQINVVLNANHAGGRVNDSYADNLSLVITKVPEPTVSGLSLLIASCFMAGKVRRNRRQFN
ncbi:MAG: PEP-CTERM sorting domain-containing protein [Trichormus sp.]